MTLPEEPAVNKVTAPSGSRSDSELDELLGAYALNAVDASERAEIETYVRRSPRAATELSEHLEVAAALGNSIGEAPPRLWEKISLLLPADPTTSVSSTRVSQASSGGSVASIEGHRSRQAVARQLQPTWRRAVAPFLVAASVTAIGGLGAQVMRQDTRISSLQQQVAAAERSDAALQRILAAPQTRIVQLSNDAGQPMAKVALASDGTGYVFGSTLPPLPSGKTYQLWGVADGTVLSLGVFGTNPETTAFAAAGSWSQFVFTAESGSGVVASKAAAVAAGKLS
jgi:Anti-sigma-K factor rskA